MMMGSKRTRELVTVLPSQGNYLNDAELNEEIECPVDTYSIGRWTGRYDIADHQGLICTAERVKYSAPGHSES